MQLPLLVTSHSSTRLISESPSCQSLSSPAHLPATQRGAAKPSKLTVEIRSVPDVDVVQLKVRSTGPVHVRSNNQAEEFNLSSSKKDEGSSSKRKGSKKRRGSNKDVSTGFNPIPTSSEIFQIEPDPTRRPHTSTVFAYWSNPGLSSHWASTRGVAVTAATKASYADAEHGAELLPPSSRQYYKDMVPKLKTHSVLAVNTGQPQASSTGPVAVHSNQEEGTVEKFAPLSKGAANREVPVERGEPGPSSPLNPNHAALQSRVRVKKPSKHHRSSSLSGAELMQDPSPVAFDRVRPSSSEGKHGR